MGEDNLKITSVELQGMHKVDKAKYNLSDITYFTGPNGTGKSTILEAIQLAILGYIPGYPKTNEGIMRHANGPMMRVELNFDNGQHLSRMYIRQGSSVKCTVDADVEGHENPDTLLGQLELPLFNFNDFRNMTANKLKEWFIAYLPTASNEVNLRSEFVQSLSDRPGLLPDGYLDEILATIETADAEGIELVKHANEALKEEQTYLKGQVSSLQHTVNSLVYYDDCDQVDEEEISAKLDSLKSQLVKANTQMQLNASRQSLMLKFDSLLGGMANKSELESKYNELAEQYNEQEAIVAKLEANPVEIAVPDNSELTRQIAELNAAIALTESRISSDICPYTNKKCESIAKGLEPLKIELADLQAEKADLEIAKAENDAVRAEAEAKIAEYKAQVASARSKMQQMFQPINAIKNRIDQIGIIENQLSEIGLVTVEYDIDSIKSAIAELERTKEKLAANKQYNELISKLNTKKLEDENKLECVKIWVKLTDANNLQTKLAEAQFEVLATSMTSYMQKMFNDNSIACKFNITSKANSFSFGIVKDSAYIEYDLLSSGEKCLYMIAMMIGLIAESDSQIKLLLLDDVLDHLDDDNASRLFEGISSIDAAQVVMAGVKACNNQGICRKVE